MGHFSTPNGVRAALNRGTGVGSQLKLSFTSLIGIRNGGSSEPPLQATELAELLMRKPRGLRTIMMYHVTLLGDLEPLLEAFRQQQNFCYFFSQCGNFDQRRIIDGVKDIPSLEQLVICGHSSSIEAELPSLTDLLHRRPNLKTLDVGTIAPTSDEAAAEFFETAKNAPNLKRLEVYLNTAGLPSKQLTFLGDMLCGNAGGLEQLVVCARTSESLHPIAKGLVGNTTLNRLKVRLQTEPRDADLDAFAEAMRENFALKRLELWKEYRWNSQDIDWEPIYEDRRVQQTFREIEFYLKLNVMGRYQVLADRNHTATAEEWLQKIADKEDVSVIYYFARQNPLVCLPKSLGGVCPAPTAETRARDAAQEAARYRDLYGSGFHADSEMKLRGAKNVKEALRCPVRPFTTLCIEFNTFGRGQEGDSTIDARDLAALIHRAPMSLNKIMLYFVKVQGDFGPVVRAIRGKKLEHFFAQGSTFDADLLVKTLSGLPSFASLTLTWAHPKITTLTELLTKRPNLTNLSVSGVPTPSESEAEDFLVAVGTAKHLKSLLLFWSHSHLTGPTVGLVGKMLANHPAIESLEMKVASNVSLAPLALGLHDNKSLARLTVSVDNLQPHNPTLNDDDIRCFLHLLQVKNCTLKYLKVTNDSWHGDHLWKPQYARNSVTRSRLEKIQNLLQQNGEGRVLLRTVSAPENDGSAPRLPPQAYGSAPAVSDREDDASDTKGDVSDSNSKTTQTEDRIASLEARLEEMSKESASGKNMKVNLVQTVQNLERQSARQNVQITVLEQRIDQLEREKKSCEQESSTRRVAEGNLRRSSRTRGVFPLKLKLRRKKREDS